MSRAESGTHGPDLAEFSSQIFTDSGKKQAQGEKSELSVLSIGIQLEPAAVEFFATVVRQAS